MTPKEKQRELIVEIMKADEQSGIYPAMKQTAVDWLFNKLLLMNPNLLGFGDYLEQAKEMEKKQIEEAHLNGQSEWDINSLGDIQKNLAEQYYKETYNK